MEIINRLVELNNGSFHASKDDMEILKEAASYNDYLGINYYQSCFIRYYDGENDIFHNGTGEKGTSRFCLKGVGERMDKEEIPKTDWYRTCHIILYTIREGSFNIYIGCNRPDLGDMLPPLKSLILKWRLLAQWLY